MYGSTVSFFDIAASPSVGETLLDLRPAFVFASDGSRLLFANAAAVAALGASNLDDLLALRFTDLNPIRAQMARLSRTLPTEQPRLEVLRFGGGVSSVTMTSACRRLNLANDERAVLAIGATALAGESFHVRTERLVEVLAGGDAQVTLIADGGKIVTASETRDELLDTSDIRELAAAAASSPGRRATEKTRRHGEAIHAEAVHFTSDGRELALVVVNLVREAVPAPAPREAAIAIAPVIVTEAAAIEQPPPRSSPPEPVSPPADASPPAEAPPAATRFVFELDRDGQFLAVGPELSAAVGSSNGAVAGHFWTDLAEAFGSAGDAVTRALATGTGFSAKLPWPSEDGGAREVELTAISNPRTRGHRGFGLVGEAAAEKPHRPTLNLGAAIAATPAASVEPPVAATEPAEEPAAAPPDNAPAATSDENVVEMRATETMATPAAEPPAPTEASNIVRLPGAPIVRAPLEPLSGIERDAFRRIAEALGTLNLGATVPQSAEAVSAASAAPDAAKATTPGDGIDARLLDRLPLGIVVFREGRTLFANRTLLDLLGYPSSDAFTQSGGPEAIFPRGDDIADRVSAAEGTLLACRSDGSTIQVKAWLHAVPFAGATALLLAIAAVDGDKSLVSALADSEARVDELEAVLDTATDGVIVVDRRGKMQSMNRAAEALFGIDASQYFDRYFTDLLADESQKAALDYLDGLMTNGVASVLNDGREVIGRTPSGGLIPLFMTMGRIGTSDKFCAVLRDITHWKNVEEELVAARRAAETANTQKSDFLAKISHEIRTPLNAIIGFSEVMASERFGPVGNERYRQYLRDIHVSGSHLMSLINDLLDLSKIEAGKVDLAFEAVPVNTAIQECVALMQPQANRERIIIRTALAADVPSVVADPRSLRQILLNLLSNAVKFTRAGGQVIVSSSLEANGEVVVRVRDTGIGMSEKDVETALKPFRQVALAKEDRDQGTGLGLPLTKALVEANRATFAIDSAPNQGTLVKITFPTTRVLAS